MAQIKIRPEEALKRSPIVPGGNRSFIEISISLSVIISIPFLKSQKNGSNPKNDAVETKKSKVEIILTRIDLIREVSQIDISTTQVVRIVEIVPYQGLIKKLSMSFSLIVETP